MHSTGSTDSVSTDSVNTDSVNTDSANTETEARSPLLMELAAAVEGLYCASESDYPYEIVQLDAVPDSIDGDLGAIAADLSDDGAGARSASSDSLSPEILLQATGHEAESSVEELTLEQFFAPMVQEQDWFGDEEKEYSQRYQSLVELLQTQLTQVKVYRVGDVELDIYIVGRSPAGEWVGVMTKMVET
jgi:hypothetical protein